MIISASYRTDIPAFYGQWFMNRLQAGYCKVVNPYGGQVHLISLAHADVDGFVFWTKNAGPFLPQLQEIKKQGYPFVVQYSLTGYPRSLEPGVADADRGAAHMEQIAADFGPRVVVWRYDPILFTSETPAEFHRANFRRLARRLEGVVDEVTISFAQIYQKTRRNLDQVATAAGLAWWDVPDEDKLSLAQEFTVVARQYGMQLTVCSQKHLLPWGAQEARCIDARRLSDVAGRRIAARKAGNRPDCCCHASRDIGQYDTCLHGCVYCYAVKGRAVALDRYRYHDPEGEFLLTPNFRRPSVPGKGGAGE